MNYRCIRAGPFSGNSSWYLCLVTGLLPCSVCLLVCICVDAHTCNRYRIYDLANLICSLFNVTHTLSFNICSVALLSSYTSCTSRFVIYDLEIHKQDPDKSSVQVSQAGFIKEELNHCVEDLYLLHI